MLVFAMSRLSGLMERFFGQFRQDQEFTNSKEVST
jgi:hypothetical protein